MVRILIYGAGGHGQVVADILMCMRRNRHAVVTVGFIDDNLNKKGSEFLGLPVVGDEREFGKIEHDGVIVAVGENSTRKKIVCRLEAAGERFVSAIHPSAVIASDAIVKSGSMICAGAIVNTGTIVGDHVILNTACSVDHHNRIDSFAHIAPGAHLGGEVKVGQGALLGIGASVLPRISIGEWAVIGSGSVVKKNVPTGALAVGNPCRIIKVRPQQTT